MKNQQALLVALSYIIGFTTGYIAFGLDDLGHGGSWKYHEEARSHSGKNASGHINQQIGIAVREDGLYALIDEKERILSAQAASVSATKPGWHYKVIKTEVSPNNRFVYYCAQTSVEEDSCWHFVYVASEDVVYKVSRADGQQINSDIGSLISGWTVDNLLAINSYISADKQKPWRVVER